MRSICDSSKKKVRGLKRQMRVLDAWRRSFEGFYPEGPDRDGCWYEKLPIHEGLVRGPRARNRIKRRVIGALLDVCQMMRHSKPAGHRVVAIVNPSDLFHASVDVFFSDEAYRESMDRPGVDGQTSTPIDGGSFLKGWQLPHDMPERGYHQEIHVVGDEEEYHWSGDIWLIGDVE